VIGVMRPMDALLEAYRSGGGVPYAAYGVDAVAGIAATNRPQFHNLLADWFAAMPPVDARLRADPPARVADHRLRIGVVEYRDRPGVPEGQDRRDRRGPRFDRGDARQRRRGGS
jgi:hypothetical protein